MNRKQTASLSSSFGTVEGGIDGCSPHGGGDSALQKKHADVVQTTSDSFQYTFQDAVDLGGIVRQRLEEVTALRRQQDGRPSRKLTYPCQAVEMVNPTEAAFDEVEFWLAGAEELLEPI